MKIVTQNHYTLHIPNITQHSIHSFMQDSHDQNSCASGASRKENYLSLRHVLLVLRLLLYAVSRPWEFRRRIPWNKGMMFWG